MSITAYEGRRAAPPCDPERESIRRTVAVQAEKIACLNTALRELAIALGEALGEVQALLAEREAELAVLACARSTEKEWATQVCKDCGSCPTCLARQRHAELVRKRL